MKGYLLPLHDYHYWFPYFSVPFKVSFLQDSGGFQMVSLVEFSKVTEEGVHFSSPYDGKQILLTPEKSIEIQNALGNYSVLYNNMTLK